MNWISRSIAVVTVGLLALPSCKKNPTERLASDLQEAGYQLTTDDWFRAARQNDVAVMKKFVAAEFPVTTRNGEGDSALHAAAGVGAIAAADYLLTRKLPVDVLGAAERTPLMTAVIANQPQMVGWLLRQGADPHFKDSDGFKPLLLAAREGSARCVGELASYDREDLDSALLLAAMEGRVDVIDALTSYGASVHTRMADGRTPLMIAAQNGHQDAAQLLLDIGALRFTTDAEGRTAAEIAMAAGHPDIAEWVSRAPQPAEFGLESPTEIAGAMDAFVSRGEPRDAASGRRSAGTGSARPIAGEVVSARVENSPSTVSFEIPPLVMRHYREREIPIRVRSVKGDVATLQISGAPTREIKVRAGEGVPGSNLVVVKVQRRLADRKDDPGGQHEVSVVEVRDRSNGVTREWIVGVPAAAHDPVALVEDVATGLRYTASPGQRFTAADGTEFLVSEVRPNQLVIRESATGAVRTIPLRGPRG